ncbi:hypothetical protein ASD75_22660 [Acidovorax sp. Root568]|nr:hypothetical protein ASD75_22660 [Acidovorax sp. Root568]
MALVDDGTNFALRSHRGIGVAAWLTLNNTDKVRVNCQWVGAGAFIVKYGVLRGGANYLRAVKLQVNHPGAGIIDAKVFNAQRFPGPDIQRCFSDFFGGGLTWHELHHMLRLRGCRQQYQNSGG